MGDLGSWLLELRHQQKSRDSRISGIELRRAWDRWLDAFNAARAQGETVTDDLAGDPLIGHIPLSTGELVTVHTADDRIVVALYAARSDEETAGDDTVLPAQAMMLDADEAEMLGSLITLGAVSVYGQRHRLRVVDDQGGGDR